MSETEDPGLEPEAAAPDIAATESQPELSAEDRAMAMGWTPLSQFKGDPAKFVGAEDFVKRGEEFLPFLKANNRRLEQALDRANAKQASLEKGLESAIAHLSRADERAYAKAKTDLEADLATYAAAGDVENVKSVTQDIVALEKEVTAKPAADPPGEPPEFTAWKADNPWYGVDKALTAACVALGNEAYEEGYTGKAQAKEVDRRLREKFPDKFAKASNPNRQLASAVEGGGGARRAAGSGFSDMSADAQAMCNDLAKIIPNFSKEKYVRDHFKAKAT